MSVLYLAYGSNMAVSRIEARLGRCACLGAVSLAAYRLAFHKRGRDASGKCDALFTGEAGDRLYGVLYRLTGAQARRLDEFEGPGYERRTVAVHGARERLAYAYVARPDAIEPGLAPYRWYRELVLAGARGSGLPAAYVAGIEAVATIPDPDPERAAAHFRLLDPGVGRGI